VSGDRGYYLTAEPVGVCSCHACTCPGCYECDPRDDCDTDEETEPDDDDER